MRQHAERKSYIITFKEKEDRPDKKVDKTEVVLAALKRDVTFYEAGTLAPKDIPQDMHPESIGYDINQYEVPILTTYLSEDEKKALKGNPNIEAIEEDGLCFAFDYPTHTLGGASGVMLNGVAHRNPRFLIEGQPELQSETIPAGISQIKAPLAWDATRGKGVKVAVLDSGIDYQHPDLASNYRGGVSFVPDETTPMDYNSHGTHCAGTIAASITGSGVVGVAPAAYLYAVKVLSRAGSGNWSWLIAGLDWCVRNKIHIASMSLGGESAPNALKNMCDFAYKNGVLLVAAAGNSGNAVGVPAKYESVMAISAIDSNNLIAPFSCRGPEVELCAPGVQVLSTIPGGSHGKMSGTSMACPHVAGAAALAWGTHRHSNNTTIRRLLCATADILGTPGRDDLYGYGRANAEQAAFQFSSSAAATTIGVKGLAIETAVSV